MNIGFLTKIKREHDCYCCSTELNGIKMKKGKTGIKYKNKYGWHTIHPRCYQKEIREELRHIQNYIKIGDINEIK